MCRSQVAKEFHHLQLSSKVYGHLISDVNITHGGKKMKSAPNGIMIPIVFKGGLLYTKHYYPTDAQMRNVKQEEITTSPEK